MSKLLLLGCIADDFTGATDLANNLVRSGMRVMQTMGVPTEPLPADANVDAVVVALKSRTLPPSEAVVQSLAALEWLQAQSPDPHGLQIYFKYCSTFDSVFTPAVQGNIGAVADALMEALGTDFTIATPAFPDNGRTVFKGHLFVGDVLLSESGMQNHPLTPMTDSNLVRVLQAQTQKKVGLIDYKTVAAGDEAITAQIQRLRQQGVRMAVVDALSNQDLMRLGKALKGLPLVTAGSGVAIGLPQNFGIASSNTSSQLPVPRGLQAIVSGSCSLASNAQVAHGIASGLPALAIDPLAIVEKQTAGVDVVAEALTWAKTNFEKLAGGQAASPILIYATADAASVKAVQAKLGVALAGEMVEQTLSRIAVGLVELGVRQLVVAGGETSGACVQALGLTQMQIGPQIDPGVPWCYVPSPMGLHLALKSGNFGTEDFFSKAFEVLK